MSQRPGALFSLKAKLISSKLLSNFTSTMMVSLVEVGTEVLSWNPLPKFASAKHSEDYEQAMIAAIFGAACVLVFLKPFFPGDLPRWSSNRQVGQLISLMTKLPLSNQKKITGFDTVSNLFVYQSLTFKKWHKLFTGPNVSEYLAAKQLVQVSKKGSVDMRQADKAHPNQAVHLLHVDAHKCGGQEERLPRKENDRWNTKAKKNLKLWEMCHLFLSQSWLIKHLETNIE